MRGRDAHSYIRLLEAKLHPPTGSQATSAYWKPSYIRLLEAKLAELGATDVRVASTARYKRGDLNV